MKQQNNTETKERETDFHLVAYADLYKHKEAGLYSFFRLSSPSLQTTPEVNTQS